MSKRKQLNDNAPEGDKRRNDEMLEQSKGGFRELGIIPSLLKGIKQLNLKTPTPIQQIAIPAGIEGSDIMALAQTGSGKTLAFGIPMTQRLLKMKSGAGLVLVPTRELAIQVRESLQAINSAVQIRSTVLIGGAPFSLQRMALKKNPRVIIATPGRLLDHIKRRTIKLDNIKVFILDEADRMLDMGFVRDIEKIIESIPKDRQTMLFSATMPKEIVSIAHRIMENPIRIEANRSGETPVEVSHELFFVKHHDKGRLLAVQLKQSTGPVLVFTRTKRMASRLNAKVNRLGFTSAEIHSDRSLNQRQRALDGFKKGRYQILIATDIAARGIDVYGIELVVNYDMPANSEDYVHRIGRTGRAGKTGHAVSFATNEQRGPAKDIERFMKNKLTISALPALPSLDELAKMAEKSGLDNDQPNNNKSSKQSFAKYRSSRRNDFKRGGSKTYGPKRNGQKQKDSRKKSRNVDSFLQAVQPDGNGI